MDAPAPYRRLTGGEDVAAGLAFGGFRCGEVGAQWRSSALPPPVGEPTAPPTALLSGHRPAGQGRRGFTRAPRRGLRGSSLPVTGMPSFSLPAERVDGQYEEAERGRIVRLHTLAGFALFATSAARGRKGGGKGQSGRRSRRPARGDDIRCGSIGRRRTAVAAESLALSADDADPAGAAPPRQSPAGVDLYSQRLRGGRPFEDTLPRRALLHPLHDVAQAFAPPRWEPDLLARRCRGGGRVVICALRGWDITRRNTPHVDGITARAGRWTSPPRSSSTWGGGAYRRRSAVITATSGAAQA